MTPSLLLLALSCAPAPRSGPSDPSSISVPHGIERVVRAGSAGPRVVVLHGYGATPEGILGLMEGLESPARLLAPQAPSPALDGWSWFPLSREVGGPDGLGPGIAAAADNIAAWMVAEGVSPKDPAVVTGFSQGGMLSFAIAARHPELVTLAVPLGGMLPPELAPEHPPPAPSPRIRAWHGADDRRVPAALAERTVRVMARAGWDAELRLVPDAGHTVPSAARMGLLDVVRALPADPVPTAPSTSRADPGPAPLDTSQRSGRASP